MGSSFSELLQTLRARKLRAFSTLFGITWGTLSVVLLLAFGTGLETEIQGRAQGMGKGIAIVWPQRTTKAFAGIGKGRYLGLREEDVRDLPLRIPELDAVSPEYQNSTRLRVGDRIHKVRISGVDPDYGQLRSMVPLPDGRFLNARDLDERRRVVFLGDRVKEALFGERNAVGELLILHGRPFTVIGVMAHKEQDGDYGGLDQDRVCIPATTHARLFARRYLSNFVYRAREPLLFEQATRRIYEVLGGLYRFDPTDRRALLVWDTLEEQRLRHYVFLGLDVLLGGSGLLTLLVGGVGIANLMYIIVRQRTREIGIRLALGTRPRRILVDVLSQTFFLVSLGGAAGVLISWLVTIIVSWTPLTEQLGTPVLSPAVAAATATLLALVGFLAGYFPARRAASLDPVLALAED